MHPPALARRWAFPTLLTLMCVLVLLAGVSVPAGAQPAAPPAVIERPTWTIGDWWEFNDASGGWRLTVIAKERDHFVLARSRRGEGVTSGEGRTTHHADVDGWITKRIAPDGKVTLSGNKHEWVKFPLRVGNRWQFTTDTPSAQSLTQGRLYTFDYDARVEGWATIEVGGRRLQALRIELSSRPRGDVGQYFNLTAWYVPEAKRIARLTPHFSSGFGKPPAVEAADMVAFGTAIAPTSPAVATQSGPIERPTWAIGDWWEFNSKDQKWRLTVIGREGEQHVLARSRSGETASKSAAAQTRYLADADGWITRILHPDGTAAPATDILSIGAPAAATPRLQPDKHDWVRFPLKPGSRWQFSAQRQNSAGQHWDYDHDGHADGWESIDVSGRQYAALKISIAYRQRGYTNYFNVAAWYVPEAKRIVRFTPLFGGGTSFEVVAFGGAERPVTTTLAEARPPVSAAPPPAGVAVPLRSAVPLASPLGAGKRLAVIIGVGAYEHAAIPKLRYAARDAEAMQRVLVERAGFKKEDVLLLTDHTSTKPTLRNIKSALGTFLARSAAKGDTVLVFFAGHGAPEVDPRGIERDGLAKYLIPSDADPEDLYATALSMDEIQTIFSRIEADRIVVFVDACYSGAAGGRTFASRRMQTRTLSVDERFLERLIGAKGRAIITASRPSEVSIELNDLQHGLFTYYVVEGLKGAADLDRDGIVTLQELYTYVEREVSRKSRAVGGNQHPVLKGELEGPFPLIVVKER